MKIKETWTYNHKHAIITLSLFIALTVIAIEPRIPRIQADTVTYHAPQSLADRVEARAIELYNSRREIDLEQYRLDAINELGDELYTLTQTSPFVDYEAIRDKYAQ